MCRLYNEGDIKRLAKRNAFDIKRKIGNPRGATRRIPAGSRGVGTYYYDKMSGVQVAYFHHYENPKGEIIGKFDPKTLLIDGVEYHLPKKGQPEPARIGNKKINQILRKTGWRAGMTYIYHVSEQAQKLWKEQVRNRLVRWGIMESREWLFA
jgi:hypothetical protein